MGFWSCVKSRGAAVVTFGDLERVGLFILFGAKTTDKPRSWARLECPGAGPQRVQSEAKKAPK